MIPREAKEDPKQHLFVVIAFEEFFTNALGHSSTKAKEQELIACQ